MVHLTPRSLLIGCISLLATTPPSSCRVLLQSDADLLADDELPIFQLVSSINVSQPYAGSSQIPVFNSTLEMDTAASFASQWVSGREQTWQDGNTRWNVTAQFADTTANGTYTAALHSAPCGSFSAETLYVPPGNDTIDFAGNVLVSGGMASFSLSYPFLIDYDRVESIVIYPGFTTVGTDYLACAIMVPPAPDFPSDWSAMIEANFVDRGVTFTMRQLYSQSLNKARMDFTSYSTDRIILQDFAAGSEVFISPQNATYPHGSCSFRQIPPFLNDMTDDTNVSLVDTSDFLRFDYSQVQYSPGHEVVRGITCEKWTRTDRYERFNHSGNYNATFYFPVNQWQIGRQDYHRLLKEIHVEGSSDDGRDFEMQFEYINFKPQNYTNNSAAFDVCALAPQGSGCNCTRERIAALNGLQLNSDPDSVVVDDSTQNGQGTCQLSSSSPHGFISSQAGPYVGLVIIGMVAGALFSFLGTWFYYRRFVGLGAGDRMGHMRYKDGPM